MPASPDSPVIQIVLPFKDQVLADWFQAEDLPTVAIKPAFVNSKIHKELEVQEKKLLLAN